MNEETKRKISDSLVKYYADNPVGEETRQKLSKVWLGRTHSVESKQRMSEVQQEIWTPEKRQQQSETQTRYHATHTVSEETRQKISDSNMGRESTHSNLGKPLSEEAKHKISVANTGHTHTEESLRKMSEARRKHGISEETKEKISQTLTGHTRSPESCLRASESMIERWKDPGYARSALSYQKPNESELQLQSVLDKHFPGDWKYVGDGQVNLGGRHPDFINVNGKKQVIEVFGVYWHNPIVFPERPTEEELIVHYKEYGFDCLVFWEYDVWNEGEVVACIHTTFCQKVSG